MRSVKDFNQVAVAQFIEKIMDRAAVSFGKIAGVTIHSKAVEIVVSEDSDIKLSHGKNGKTLSVLVTPLLGELAGRSYLIMDHREVDILLDKSPFKPSGGFDDSLKEALLKEIDNILSASVITEVANQFDIDVYGDVPELLTMTGKDFPDMLQQYVPNGQLSLICTCHFTMKDTPEFSPEFVWKFSSAMLSQIEKSASN